jgi:hypothetical protein
VSAFPRSVEREALGRLKPTGLAGRGALSSFQVNGQVGFFIEPKSRYGTFASD